MKKFTLFSLLCFCVSGAFAQWNSSTSPTGIHYTAGNVGIGTTSPQYKLHLWSTDLNPVFYIDANDAYLSFARHFLDLKAKSTFNQVPYISWTAPSGQRQAFLGWRTDCFGLTLENGYNFSINGGNVGIGTSTTDAKLSIEGSGAWQLRLKDTSGGQDWRIGSTGTSWNSGAGKFIITNAVNSDNPAIIIDAERRVGIGTTSPDARLAVKGTIHSQEVKVDLQGAVAPDYVFEKEYKLRSLGEVESYIQENKHLPEVPSAKEMEAQGIHLKEMNLLLLKKVEELTLYVIELKKEINELKK